MKTALTIGVLLLTQIGHADCSSVYTDAIQKIESSESATANSMAKGLSLDSGPGAILVSTSTTTTVPLLTTSEIGGTQKDSLLKVSVVLMETKNNATGGLYTLALYKELQKKGYNKDKKIMVQTIRELNETGSLCTGSIANYDGLKSLILSE